MTTQTAIAAPADGPAIVLNLQPKDRECSRLFATAIIAGFKEKVSREKLQETLYAYIERLSEDALRKLANARAKDVATTVINCLGPDQEARVHQALAEDAQGARSIIEWIDGYLPRLRYGVEKALAGGVPPLRRVSG